MGETEINRERERRNFAMIVPMSARAVRPGRP